ncbi:MAG: hypothetical protein IT373_06605, partial [Polyangiaceae bacterium]|nr:hypothetical protein [Polyangiaceae bacterium]
MRDEVARAALRAAAGLALTTAVLGCGQVVLDQREARGTGSGGGPAGGGGAGGLATSTEPPTCSDPGGTPGEEVGCCSELAHEAFPEGVVPDPASVAPEVKA